MEGSGELVTLEEGWARLRSQGIEKVQRFLEQKPERSHGNKHLCVVSNQDYAAIYTWDHRRSAILWSKLPLAPPSVTIERSPFLRCINCPWASAPGMGVHQGVLPGVCAQDGLHNVHATLSVQFLTRPLPALWRFYRPLRALNGGKSRVCLVVD